MEVIGLGPTIATVCTGLETYGKQLQSAVAGDNAAVLLRGVRRADMRRGQVVALPGSVTAVHGFTAQVYALTHEEGGRHTPFFSNYRPQFFFRTANVDGTITVNSGAMVMPGDAADLSVELGQPVAVTVGQQFAIREGNRTVGVGSVTRVLH